MLILHIPERTKQVMTAFRLEELGGSATKEFSMEKNLAKMKSEWDDLVFNFLPYREGDVS